MIEQNNIISIIEGDVKIGVMLSNAVKRARGKYVCFLDDDDIFYHDKLAAVSGFIKEYTDLVYYHNAFDSIDESGAPVYDRKHIHPLEAITIHDQENMRIKKLKKRSGDINMSSITIKKELIEKNRDRLEKIEGLQDVFLFYIAVSDAGTKVLDSRAYTGYRIHSSESHGDTFSLEKYISSMTSVTKKYINTYEILLPVEGKIWNELKYEYITNLCRFYLMTLEENRNCNLRNFLFMFTNLGYAETLRNQITLLGLSMLKKLFPRKARGVYLSRKYKYESSLYSLNK